MEPRTERISLSALGVQKDPGTDWHPRTDKAEARSVNGLLRDLNYSEVEKHKAKPEAQEQPDAGLYLSAEDSALTPEGHI